MSPYQLKRLHGHRLRFWGGLGTQQLLPYGTPQQVRDEVLRLTREMGRGGGYVFTTAKPIFKEVPVENAVAVIATLLELHGETL
jgi:uroporphyrinogen decarboxylase